MTVRGTGRRTFFHQRGANARLAPEHFDFSGVTARTFYLGYALLLDTLDGPDERGVPRAAEVLQRARAAGMMTLLDCVSENSDRFRPVVLPLLPHVDVLFCNDFEAEKLTGRDLGRDEHLNRDEVAAAGRDLLAAGVGRWVVLHHPGGACAVGRDGRVHFHGSVKLPEGEVAGTAGAGDAFAAGVIHGLHEGWDMRRGLELGVGTAAASLRHASCSEAIGSAAACLALGAKFGYR
ncbi:MAG: carbohydrate kinase family protein [Opitutales bacterium]